MEQTKPIAFHFLKLLLNELKVNGRRKYIARANNTPAIATTGVISVIGLRFSTGRDSPISAMDDFVFHRREILFLRFIDSQSRAMSFSRNHSLGHKRQFSLTNFIPQSIIYSRFTIFQTSNFQLVLLFIT